MMIAKITWILVGALAFSISSKIFWKTIDYPEISSKVRFRVDPSKVEAYSILDNKCNVCHRKRNRRRVFTKDNMNTWADDVYKQVFVKKRMPKGKDIKLTEEELQTLSTWINSTKNQ